MEHSPPGIFVDLGVLGNFDTKVKLKEIVKIHKDFEL